MTLIQVCLCVLSMVTVIYSADGQTARREPGVYTQRGYIYVYDGQRIYNTTYTEKQFLRMYPDVFLTHAEYAKRYSLKYKRRNFCRVKTRPWRRQRRSASTDCPPPCDFGEHDGDLCCGTCRYFEDVAETFVTVEGQPCWVLTLRGLGRYQHTPIGTCSTGGSCPGTCSVETQLHQIVCWKPWGFYSHYIEKPSYCSCKN